MMYGIDFEIDTFQRGIDESKRALNPDQLAEYSRRRQVVAAKFAHLVADRREVGPGIYEPFNTGRTITDLWEETRPVFIRLSHRTFPGLPDGGRYDDYGLHMVAPRVRIGDPASLPLHPDIVNSLLIASCSFSSAQTTVASLRDLRAYQAGLGVVDSFLAPSHASQ